MSEADSNPISVAAAAATVRRRAQRAAQNVPLSLPVVDLCDQAAHAANVAERRYTRNGLAVLDKDIIPKVRELADQSPCALLKLGLIQLEGALEYRIAFESELRTRSSAPMPSLDMQAMPSVSL